MHKIFRIFIILFLALSATIVVGQSCYNQPTYASMGSTGGGSTSTGGGSSSGGGGWSSSDSDSDADFFDLHSWGVILLIFLVLGGLVYLEMLFSRFCYWLRKIHYAYHLKRQYNSTYLIKIGFKLGSRLDPIKDLKSKSDNAYTLFQPNLTISKFEKMLRLTKIKLVENKNNELDDSFTETYVQAQYLYSQLLREKYVNRHHSLHLLRKYLDKYFYKAMVKEIKLKISQGTIDDTVVNNIEVVKYAKLDENLIITQLNVNGQDKEVQFNEGFEDSFARDTWSDYVIFGKTKSGQYKIVSLVYGEHFQLNGRDYNRQRNLRHTQYFERRK